MGMNSTYPKLFQTTQSPWIKAGNIFTRPNWNGTLSLFIVMIFQGSPHRRSWLWAVHREVLGYRRSQILPVISWIKIHTAKDQGSSLVVFKYFQWSSGLSIKIKDQGLRLSIKFGCLRVLLGISTNFEHWKISQQFHEKMSQKFCSLKDLTNTDKCQNHLSEKIGFETHHTVQCTTIITLVQSPSSFSSTSSS